jgi:hypothetical protein
VSAPQTRLTACAACGRYHLTTSLIHDPDRPDILLCPVRTRGVMRLAPLERAEADRLLRSAFGE